jgi:hypothetical protein
MSNLLVIPDTQAKPGDKLKHIEALNRYILDKRPATIVQLGDLWDFPSLSSYDKGKKSAEGKRLIDDWEIGCELVAVLMDGWDAVNYTPSLWYTAGNHEARVNRYAEDNGEFDGFMPDYMQFMRDMGWNASEFLEPVVVQGIHFCHFFPKNAKGGLTAKPKGAPSAMAQLKNNMVSCIAGHKQGYDSAMYSPQGERIRAEIVGSFYVHNEAYMGPHANDHWRGVLWLNRVNGLGDYDKTEVSLDYLMEAYG